MTENTSVALHRKVHQAAHTGDMKTLTEMIAGDVVWHSPGRSAISGNFHGREAVMAHFFGKMAELSGGTAGFEDIENNTYFGSGDHSAAFFHWTAVRDGNSETYPVYEVIRWRDGQIVEEWGFYDDQYGWDALWS
jgi:ketosteroid isomerase-like protein